MRADLDLELDLELVRRVWLLDLGWRWVFFVCLEFGGGFATLASGFWLLASGFWLSLHIDKPVRPCMRFALRR